MSDAPVLFEVLPSQAGKAIGLITMNVEASLNSLSLAMTDLIQDKLNEWESDDTIAAVFLHSAGEKAFCAGGDIRQLYDAIVDAGDGHNQYALDFWGREYRLDYHIHTYKKPIVVWATGFVMGGGIGLVAGCSHRVVTENTRMAMPEVNIGLFPDVGGTWFLQRAPGRSGMFAAMTGAAINGADALFMRMADRFVSSELRQQVIDGLATIEWSENAAKHDAQVSQLLRGFEAQSQGLKPAQNVLPNLDEIQRLTDFDDLVEMADAISSYAGDNKWLARAAKNLKNGCPTSIALAYEQYKRGTHFSLKEVFQFELIVVMACARHNNFKEGVRALLVDKDRNPSFRPATVGELSDEFIEQHFQEPWPAGEHPLRDL